MNKHTEILVVETRGKKRGRLHIVRKDLYYSRSRLLNCYPLMDDGSCHWWPESIKRSTIKPVKKHKFLFSSRGAAVKVAGIWLHISVEDSLKKSPKFTLFKNSTPYESLYGFRYPSLEPAISEMLVDFLERNPKVLIEGRLSPEGASMERWKEDLERVRLS